MVSIDGKIATSSPPIQERTGSKKDMGVAMDLTIPSPSAPRPRTLLDLVLTRLHNSPDSPAISFIDPSHPTSSTTLTTTQLFRLATRIQWNAHIVAGSIVPICMARGRRPIFIASMLAVLCAGAAYVVLDAENGPSARERNLKIAREVRADKILADTEGKGMMSDANEIWEVVDVEGILASDWSGSEGGEVPRTIEVAPEDPAFIIYTSGSTGTPKGIVISHRAVVAGLAHPLKCLFAPGPAPRWLSFFAPPTAATQRMTWSMLVHGGCLCVASREAVTTRLGETLAQLQVQGLGITPSALMSLLDAERMPTDAQLQVILLGGERAGPNIVRTWTPRVQLYAWYGLAECFNLSMVEQLVNGKDPSLHAPPADTSAVYIVNEDGDGRLTLVEPHQEGELCIAGPQLATGYLYNEAETSRVFSSNPFADGGPKLLRTGDRAVWETGEDSLLAIRIVGRTDWQIKIAGQRVAPEEVTAVLREDELFQDAVALGAKVREESVLVGAIVMKSGATAGFWQELPILRQRLAQRLPAYMVPTHWLPVEAIPMNAAGKIDLCQLRTIVEVSDPSALLGRVRVGTEGPGEEWSGTEAAIRDIWAEVLGLPAASIRHEDSFQALGGTSLLGLRVLVLMRRTGLGLELRELLDAETLESLAARVTVTAKQDASEAAEIAPFSLLKDPEARERFPNWSGAVDAYPLMPMQLYFALTAMHGMEPYLLHRLWRLPTSTLREVDRLREAFAVVFAHPQHAVLRTVFVPDAQYGLVQVVRGDMDLPWSTSSPEGDDEQALMAYERAHVTELFLNPDRLAWAVKLLPQGRLLVSAHHALFDWWSWPFLYHEVARVFHGMAVLPRAPYKAYVAHYMSQDHAQMMPKIRANREKTSAIRSKIMDAYQDHLLPSPTCSHILQLPASLMPHLVQRRINFSAAVLAAWLAVMARRILGQDIVRTGTTTSFRDVPVAGVDAMNGCAMGTCGLCIDVQPNESIGGLVSRVYEHLWEAIDMAHLSVATLISERAPVAVDAIVNILLTSNDNQAMDLELCELADVIKLHGKQQPKNEEKEGGVEGEREVENDASEPMADGVRARQLFGRGSRYGMMNMNFCTVQILPSPQSENLVLYLQAPLDKGLLDEWVTLTFGILVAIADDPDALVEDLVPPKA